jgi:membrane protein
MSVMERLEDTPVVGTALAVNERYTDDLGNHLAASIAFFGFLSLFPLILLALSVAGLVLAADPAAQAQLADRIAAAVPGLGEAIGDAIDRVVAARGVTGIVGFVLVLFSGLRVIDAASLAVSRVFRVQPEAGAVKKKLVALGNLVLLGFLTVLATSAGALAGLVGAGADALGAPEWLVRGRVVLAPVLSFALDTLLFLTAYRVLVLRAGPPLRDLVPGALLAAAGWTALKVFGAAYVGNQAANWDGLYGTLGGIIAAMLLLFLAARIFLYGAELNALRSERRHGTPAPTLDA